MSGQINLCFLFLVFAVSGTDNKCVGARGKMKEVEDRLLMEEEHKSR